ncbi:MAG TPA: type II secretion system F family protein [Vicinamibacterales bacterium]|nr:type II secretion system F family protein [Vicinamibacterales bacterium]
MLLPVLVFIAVTAMVLGSYAAYTRLPAMLRQRRLDRRLREVSAPAVLSGQSETVLMRTAAGPLPALERMAAGTRGGMWLARLIQQSGRRTSPGAVVLFCVVVALAVGVVTALFARQPWLPFVTAAVASIAPIGVLMRRRHVRMKKFEEQFPEALDLLSRAIRAGHAFQTAMNMVANELPDPVGTEFRKTFEQQNFGLPLRDALNAMTDRIPIIDVRFFVTAVLIQRETGGNLSEILDNLAHVVRERFKVLRQVRVHTAHGRFTGYVLMALPAALAIALSFINPSHMQLLFRESMGQTMLMATVVMQVIGFFWIQRVIKIEV